MVFFWLNSVELAKERVKQRVLNGGHSIPDDVIERRYKAGIKNLNTIFCNLVDSWRIYDNSKNETELIAEKGLKSDLQIADIEKYKLITNGK